MKRWIFATAPRDMRSPTGFSVLRSNSRTSSFSHSLIAGAALSLSRPEMILVICLIGLFWRWTALIAPGLFGSWSLSLVCDHEGLDERYRGFPSGFFPRTDNSPEDRFDAPSRWGTVIGPSRYLRVRW
jgi:hypothetical protein